MLQTILRLAAIAVISYLLGSISTGIILSGKKDVNIREEGSHNPGASNMLRVMGTRWGIMTFIGDALKASLSCAAALLILPQGAFGIEKLGLLMAGLFVTIGHDYPLYYGFKGGKGVACAVASLLFIDPLLGGISIVLCLLTMLLTRYISLSSLTMLFSFFVLNTVFHWGEFVRILFTLALFLLCLYRHKSNLQRLFRGEERKIGQKEAKH